jgi:hypothetical protein
VTMNSILLALYLLLAPGSVHQVSTRWAWFRASSLIDNWDLHRGLADVVIYGQGFRATLWDENDPKFARLSLVGTIRNNVVSVKATINASDAEPFRTTGTLQRSCWEGGGREAILLTSGFGAIGLTHELVGDKCRPTQ